MKRVIVLCGVLASVALPTLAAPTTPCPTTSFSLTRLLSGGDLSDGCVDQDKGYSQFAYEGQGALPPDLVSVSIGTVVLGGGIDQHTVNFQASPAWLSPFSMSYLIEIIDEPQRVIYASSVDRTAPSIPGMTNNSTVAAMLAPDVGSPVQIMQPGIDTTSALSARSIQVANSVTPLGGLSVTQFSNTYFEQVIPEPATYAFIGSGLLALAILRRRRA